MSEIEGGGSGEISSSSEVSETSSAETGGESSEATQEATTEEVNESGGFDEDPDTTETLEDSNEESDELEPDEESDDSQEVGFSEGEDVDNPDSPNGELEYEDSDSSDADENGVGFADSDNDGGMDDTDDGTDNIDGSQNEDEQMEAPDSTADGDETNDNVDGNPDDADTEDDGNIDDDYNEDEDPGEVEQYSDEDLDSTVDGDEANDNVDGNPDDADTNNEADTEGNDNIDNAEDEGDHTEAPDSTADGDETNDNVDSDGNLDDADTNNEADTEGNDNIDNAEDEGDHTEAPDSTADGDETNDNVNGDGNLDDIDSDNEADTEDDDCNEDEDPGEVELYPDESHDTPTENNEFPDEYNETEQEKNSEEPAIEGENEEVPNRTENDDSRTGENDTTIEAIDNQHESSENNDNTSSENRSSIEEQPEDTNAKLDNVTENPDSKDAYRTAMNNMADYMNEHNYGSDDYAEYSKDPEWYRLNSELQQSLGMEVTPPTPEVARSNMSEYMNEHNYGPDDYSEYSQDPEWQKLNADLQQSLGMEATTDTVTPSPESGKDVSATELPDNCIIVNASDIDLTYAQGMDSDQFWNHHGNTKEDYMHVAEKIPDVQQALDSGKSLDEIKQDPDLKDTASAYFDPENMIKVGQQADGSYSFTDDGRHRIAAAQELGYEIPVEVTNMPENIKVSNADNMEAQTEEAAVPEDAVNKSDISNETRENLGAFEQNAWDNLSQVEKEQAVEKLRDSIAEDLQLENKPNIAYYNNEDPGDYGGYAASNNTIYINRFNMGDATETADTIAHESRHCWQHERADNPQTNQDYQFKENFDDYIRPEDDYRGYRDQPIEADARDYAQNITDNIPTGHPNETSEIAPENTTSNATENEILQREEGKGAVFDESSEIPHDIDKKVGDFESKVKAPEDYSSKFEFDTQKKLENYYKENSGELSNDQKQQLISDLKDSYDGTDKSARCDVLVPENAKDVTGVYYNGKTGKFDVAYDWKPVDTVPESRHMEVLKEGQLFDRVGPPLGRCTGAVGEDGSCATAKERSIPYHLTEDDITQEPSYHRYEVEQDFTKENLSNAIDNSMYSDDKKAEMHANLDRYYETANTKGYGDGDGLASGEIAPMFEDTTGATGGGKQYDMPFSMEELENIGMISEVPKDKY